MWAILRELKKTAHFDIELYQWQFKKIFLKKLFGYARTRKIGHEPIRSELVMAYSEITIGGEHHIYQSD